MRYKLKPLREQVIVITGASSGNGLATAREAVRRGAKLVLAARNGEALEQIRADLMSKGGELITVIADVASERDVERIAEAAVQAFGGFDSWVNNAAVGMYGTLEQVPIADHRRTFEVNYYGTLYGSRAAARYLKSRGGGAIINVGSVLGDRAIVQQGPYSATKHAVQGLTDTLRMELERERAGISVTLIKPGGCATPYSEHARNYMDKPPRVPLPLYDPAIIGDAILFACETPRRNLYIGSGGLGSSLVGRLAPRLTDYVMEVVGTRLQQKPGDPGNPAARDNLYEPRLDGHVRGSQYSRVRGTSWVVKAQKISRATWLTVGSGVIGTAVLALRARKK